MAGSVLITGGAGYLGTRLAPELLARGMKVTILDTFRHGVRPVLGFAGHPDCRLVSGDVRNRGLVAEEVARHDWVVHLAAVVGYPACAADPHEARTTNVDGTRNVCDALGKAQGLVYASTGSSYGKVDGVCTEATPIHPMSLYGTTKWEAEQIVRERRGVALRFATLFGISPRLRLDLLVNDFTYQALHHRQIVLYEGHFWRSFLHVSDAARAVAFAMEHGPGMGGEAFNVGDESLNFTKRQVALKIRERVDYHLYEADVGRDVDGRDYKVSYDRIRALGYGALTTLDQGLEELLGVLPHLELRREWTNL